MCLNFNTHNQSQTYSFNYTTLRMILEWSRENHCYLCTFNQFTPTVKENSTELTDESKANKRVNDNAVNIVYSSVVEYVSMVFGNMTIAKDMWNAIVYKFERNV